MSSSRDERYYGSLGKSRRSPPPGDTQAVGFFQTGQGGRTVLPPLSSAFPTSRFPASHTYSNQYSQPRSSPSRNDYNQPFYGPWPGNTPPQQTTPFNYYDNHDARYQAQVPYSYPSRTSPPIPSDHHGSRRLPPLNVNSPAAREERWQSSSYPPSTSFSTNIRSPTAAYPPAYAPYPPNPANSYSYPPVPDARHSVVSMEQSHVMHAGTSLSADRVAAARAEARTVSPYARTHSSVSPPTYAPQRSSAPATEEPMIKKKRKRADANQLKVLNETYNRTAFPSTEERAELARKLEMSPRSVQIWFQNKRQSMRQTSRQSGSGVPSSAHQQFSLTSQADSLLEDIPHSVGGYAGSSMSNVSGPSYVQRAPQESSRSLLAHTGQSPPLPHRRPRSHEESIDSRKWTDRGF